MKTNIGVLATKQSPQGITLTLESTQLILGIVVSFSMLIGATVKVISRFNSVENEIKDLRDDLKAVSKDLEQSKNLHNEVLRLDKKIDLHLQDYVNYKDNLTLVTNGMNEKIDHNRRRWELDLANAVKSKDSIP